jgi:hypothetical protein
MGPFIIAFSENPQVSLGFKISFELVAQAVLISFLQTIAIIFPLPT